MSRIKTGSPNAEPVNPFKKKKWNPVSSILCSEFSENLPLGSVKHCVRHVS